jgi:hypothetical protein
MAGRSAARRPAPAPGQAPAGWPPGSPGETGQSDRFWAGPLLKFTWATAVRGIRSPALAGHAGRLWRITGSSRKAGSHPAPESAPGDCPGLKSARLASLSPRVARAAGAGNGRHRYPQVSGPGSIGNNLHLGLHQTGRGQLTSTSPWHLTHISR